MSKDNINYDFYYGKQAEQFSFYRIPKTLFTNPAFSKLSSDAKILYGLMLDRMGLSIKNGWKDNEDRVFIFFTLAEVQETLHCSHNKGVQLLAELDSEKGIGLIVRVKQGMGRPTKIYVMNFLTPERETVESNETKKISVKEEVMTSEKRKSLVPKEGSHNFPKKDLIKTDKNKTEINKIETINNHQSISPSIHRSSTAHKSDRSMEIDRWKETGNIFKKNIDYDILMINEKNESLPEILEIMTETACSDASFFRINGSRVPAQKVHDRLLSLNASHIEYVLFALEENSSKIHNIRAYLLAALYNAPVTINSYYKTRVQYDLSEKNKQRW